MKPEKVGFYIFLFNDGANFLVKDLKDFELKVPLSLFYNSALKHIFHIFNKQPKKAISQSQGHTLPTLAQYYKIFYGYNL